MAEMLRQEEQRKEEEILEEQKRLDDLKKEAEEEEQKVEELKEQQREEEQKAPDIEKKRKEEEQKAKKEAEKQLIAQSHQHSISAVLQSCPGMGPIRVAETIPIIVSPHRFRTARQLWAYSGLAIVMRSSSDWVKTPHGWQRAETVRTRGLNRNHNRRLKNIFKRGSATADEPSLGSTPTRS